MTKNEVLKIMRCKQCNKIVENVGENAIFVTCSSCVQDNLNNALEEQNNETVKGGIDMEKAKEEVKEIKVSVSAQIRDLLAKNKNAEEIAKELNITKKRVQDILWQIAHKKVK